MTSFTVINLFTVVPLLFTIYLAVRNLIELRQNGYYVLACLITLLLLFLDIWFIRLEGTSTYELLLLHALGRALRFLLLPAIGFLLYLYLKDPEVSDKYLYLLWFPLVLNGLLSILSLQTGWYFSISANNTYTPGRLSWFAMLTTGFYYARILFWLLTHKKNRTIHSHGLLVFVYFLPIFSILGQIVMYHQPYVVGTIAIALFLYYILGQLSRFDFDEQTGVMNREAFEQEMYHLNQRKIDTTFFMFDLKDLKHTNDTWGHAEGDALLSRFANLLQETFAKAGKTFRIGGDEFCVVLPPLDQAEIQVRLKEFNSSLVRENKKKPTGMEVAYGYATSVHSKGIDNNKALSEADNAMFQQQRIMEQPK